MKINKVAVLYGGKSKERPGSLKTGENVIKALKKLGYNVKEVDPINDNLIDDLSDVDCVFNALHGWYGEDGKIQGFLETLNIAYTGCGVLASALCMNKILFKKVLISENIPTPKFILATDDILPDVGDLLGFPVVLKPNEEGGSLGISIIKDKNELVERYFETKKHYNDLFFEKYIDGDFMSVGLLGSYNSPKYLSILQVKFSGEFYDYEIKHTKGAAEFIIPPKIPKEKISEIQSYSERLYNIFGCHGPIRVDLMYTKDEKPYFIEINTVPGMSSIGNLTAIAQETGYTYEQLIEEILFSAFNKPIFLP